MFYMGYSPNLLMVFMPQTIQSVIPAKAGIQGISCKFGHWIPAFAGVTGVFTHAVPTWA